MSKKTTLDKHAASIIFDAIDCARLVGIEELLLTGSGIFGINSPACIIHKEEIEAFSTVFDALGISRVKTLFPRMNVMKDLSDYTVTVETSELEGSTVVDSLILKATSGGSPITTKFRCMTPDKIKNRQSVNDAPIYSISYPPEIVDLLSTMSGTMAEGKEIAISYREGVVSFALSDHTSDSFTQQLDEDAMSLLSDTDQPFTHKYPKAQLLSILKKSTDNRFEISSRGLLSSVVFRITTYLSPKA